MLSDQTEWSFCVIIYMTNIANGNKIRNIGKRFLISAANGVVVHRMATRFNSCVYTLNIQFRITRHDEIATDKIALFLCFPEHI